MKKSDIIRIAGASVILGGVFYILLVYKPLPAVQTENQARVIPEEIVVPQEEIDLSTLDVIGRTELSFVGGTEGRAKNIELGIQRIDGTVIGPGEEFSFIKTLGPVKEEDGFTEQKVFLNDAVTTGIGGGLCQVSTTLFRTVLDAGLLVTERRNHTYTVPLYDVGLDAVYADPYSDLKFVNDTDHPIVIKGRVENQNAVFEIYGKDDGRQVTISEPEITKIVDIAPTRYIGVPYLDKTKPACVNPAQIGYTAEVKYNVIYPSGEEKEKIFTSTYKPLRKVCYIETGMATTTLNPGF